MLELLLKISLVDDPGAVGSVQMNWARLNKAEVEVAIRDRVAVLVRCPRPAMKTCPRLSSLLSFLPSHRIREGSEESR